MLSQDLNAKDYSVEGSSVQKFSSNGISEVVITCFCSNNIITKRTKGTEITVEVEATLDSVGYHGEQTKPKNIADELLNFNYDISGNRLELISNEYTFMHHAFVIKSLTIYLPHNVTLRHAPVLYSTLEGRNR